MKKIIYTLLLLAIACIANAQVTQEWVATYNGPGNYEDLGFSTVDGSGNVYVTGLSWGNGTERDIVTIKYNTSGVQQWVQRYNGTGNHQDEPRLIAVDISGNVYVTGYSRSGTTEDTEDFCTIKYNSSGVQQWVQIYNGPGNNRDAGTSITVDGAGNVYVTGYSRTGSTAETEGFCTIKYNSSGAQQWIQRYDGPNPGKEVGYVIAVDNSDNVYVSGWSPGNGNADDWATIKYNSSGVQQWVQRYDGPASGADRVMSLAVDAGNVYLTGYCTGITTAKDYCTIKYNFSGVQQWVQIYNGLSGLSDYGHSLKVDGSGNVYVTGECATNGTDKDYTVIKYNSSGVQQWVSKYTGPGNFWGLPWLSQLILDNLGNSYVTAWSRGSGAAIGFAAIKYNSSGVQQWVQTYYGQMDTAGALSIAVDNSYNVYVTGSSLRIGTDYDITTIKYSQSIGIQNISTEIPLAYSLGQNYPNPFNPVTKIKFDIPLLSSIVGRSIVRLIIYDILGRDVTTLVNEQLKPGAYEVDWDGSNYPSGVYFYKLIVRQAGSSTGDFAETRKMILLK